MRQKLVNMASETLGEELDYHVTFPSPVCSEDTDGCEQAYKLDAHNDVEPVVILLGWVGCQDKHLAKYSAIYEKKGCITIRYTADTDDIFFSNHRLQPVAVKVLELIEDLSLEQSPIIFHVLSNGGGFLYRFIADSLANDERFSNIKVSGVVFDSAPSYTRSPITAVKAYMLSLRTNFFLRYLMAMCLFFIIMVKTYIGKLLSHLNLTPDSFITYWDDLADSTSRYPQCYLFSKADHLIPSNDIVKMIEYRKSLGVQVFSQCWDDSAHVCHFKEHRESYMKMCHDFLEYCINQKGEGILIK